MAGVSVTLVDTRTGTRWPSGNSKSFRVKSVKNSIQPKVDEYLTFDQVQSLIDKGWNVTFVEPV